MRHSSSISAFARTNLRLATDNFEEYWRVASKITPTTTPTRSNSPPPPPTSTSLHTRPPSADPGSSGGPDRDGASNVRNVPVRVYLPDGPVLQDLVPPVLEDGASIFMSCRLGENVIGHITVSCAGYMGTVHDIVIWTSSFSPHRQ